MSIVAEAEIAWTGAWPMTVALPGRAWGDQFASILVAGKPPSGVTSSVPAYLSADGALAPIDTEDGVSAAFDAALAASGWDAGEAAFASAIVDTRLAAQAAAVGALTLAAANDAAIWRTSDGDVADAVARAVYGAEDGGATERLLAANPGLADIGPVLPAGLYLALPPAPVVTVRSVTRLWS